MRRHSIIAIAASAFAGFALAGCGVFAPEDSEGAANASTEPPPAVEAEEHSTGLEHATAPTPEPGLAEGAVRPEDTTYSDTDSLDGYSGPEFADSVCTDEGALAANADREPAGWPAEHQAGEPLPNPECHPDFIEVESWQHYGASCWHPLAHGHVSTDEDLARVGEAPQTDQQRWAQEWEASEIRSWWTPPADPEDCFGHDGLPENAPPMPEALNISHIENGQHGLEVSATFNLESHFNLQTGTTADDDAHVLGAISQAAKIHPDYDLIVVRAYNPGSTPGENSPVIEAWYQPENVAAIDLENPDQADPYSDCYSCHVPNQHHS